MPNKPLFTIETDPPLEKLAKVFKVNHTNKIAKGVKFSGQLLAKHLRAEAPKRTGKFAKGIQSKPKGSLGYQVVVGDPFLHRIIVEGVPAERINPIFPVKKKALFWPGAAHPVKAVYNHPGLKPNDYVSRGVKAAQSDIDEISEDIGREIIADLKKI